MAAGDGVVTPGNFASSLLQQLGLPTSPAWTDIVNQWVASEGGFNASLAKATNNPLNARCDYTGAPRSGTAYKLWGYQASSGATGCTVEGFAIWPNLQDAVEGYANLLGGSTKYAGIHHAQSPDALKAAIIASPWAGGHYGNGKNWATNAASNNPVASVANTGVSGNPGLPDLNPLDAIGSLINTLETDLASVLIFLAGALLLLFGLYQLVKSKTGVGATDVLASYVGLRVAETKSARVGRAGRASPEEAYSTSAARAAGRKAGAKAPTPDAPPASPAGTPAEEAIFS